MGIFDFIEDITRVVTKTVVSAPSIPVKIVKGAADGVTEGIEEIEESLKKLIED